jgi:hypothetical protein
MAISQNFPEEGPTLNLNFAGSRTLDPRITFTRTSSATFMGRDGLVKIAPANSARFDHRYNSTTGEVESLGLLVEEARSNLITDSEAVSTWIIGNMIPTGNSVILPNGVASTEVEYRGETEDPTGKLLRPRPTGGIVAGETFVFSIFLRYGTEPTVHIVLQDNVAGQSTGRTFNLQTGVWTTNQSFNGGTSGSSGFDIYPNGWYRVWLSCTFPNSATGVQTFVRLRGNLGEVPATTSFSAWGANLEKGAFPTSYIPTGSSTATRTADTAFIGGSDLKTVFNEIEGSIIANISLPNDISVRGDATAGICGLTRYSPQISGFDGYGLTIRKDTRLFAIGHRVIDESKNVNVAISGGITESTVLPNQNYKVGFFYSPDLLGLVIGNTSSVSTLSDENYGLYPKTFLYIGRSRNGGSPPYELSGHIAQLTYYPQRLQNSQLITLTK